MALVITSNNTLIELNHLQLVITGDLAKATLPVEVTEILKGE